MAAALCVGVLAAWATRTVEPPLRTTGALTSSSSPSSTATPAPPSSPALTASSPAAERIGGIPSRISLPRLRVSMAVRPVGVDRAGRMAIPSDLGMVGWYEYGPRPGAGSGAAVLAAHVDTAENGVGPFSRLRQARVGDRVTLATSAGPLEYVVRSVSRIPKDKLDLDAVFERDGAAELHLLTCGGPFDRSTGHYEDNIVVVAAPAAGT